jgi:TolB-like protein
MIYIFLCFLFIPVLLFSQTQPTKPRIAVLPVDLMQTEEAANRKNVDSLTHEIALELAKRGRYDVLPPVQTKAVKDMVMSSDERWRHAGMQADDIQLVGTRLGAGYVIAGSLTRSGNKFLYHAWFYETDGGKVLASNFIEYSNMSEGLTLVRLLAGWLLNDVEPLETTIPNTAAAAPSSSYTTTTPGATLSTAPPPPASAGTAGTAGTALPWASIVTRPTATGIPGGGVVPGGAAPVVTGAPEVAAGPAQPLVSASADSPTSVVINIAPGPEAVAAAPAPAAAAPLVFNNNNNNNNNLGGGGSGQQQQQQGGGGASPPLFILMPQQEKPEPAPPAPAPAPEPKPEPPPPEPIIEKEPEIVEVTVTTRQLLYAGVRGGIQMRQYTASPMDEEAEEPVPITTLNVASTTGMDYEAAVFLGVQALNFLALQIDVMWVSNDISGRDDAAEATSRYQTMFSPMNLMIGAQLKFTFRIGTRFLLAPFGAFYYSMMMGGIQYTFFDEDNLEGVDYPSQVATGVINVGGGLTLGWKLGPGEIFAEVKALFDMGPTQITSTGDDDEGAISWNAYTRSILPSITLGYQFRFMNLKKTVETAAK